jgi:hypothetical protein
MAEFPRRSFIALFGVALPLRSKLIAQSDDSKERSYNSSPHAQALLLVQSTQSDEIAKAERAYFDRKGTGRYHGGVESYWWFDTIERAWSVQRPFAPGAFDSTHWFTVSYKIKDETVASWSVDTRKKTVTKA